jgi:phage FluMu protein Com
MPIRFRCRHCNQLLGIARRKAGMMVRCPTCRGEVLVPAEEVKVTERVADGPAEPAPLFERDDFEALLKNAPEPGARPPEVPRPVPGPVLAHPVGPPPPPPAEFDVEPVRRSGPAPAAAPPAGLVLSPAVATVLTVAGIILLGVAFGAGVLVGRYL